MLLRSALWETPIEHFYIPPPKFRQLIEFADEQTVSGLVGKAIMDSRNDFKLNKYDTINLYSYCGYIGEQNKAVNNELVSLCQLLKRHQIKFVVVKGQTIAALMDQPESRMPGDIDFYCDAENFSKAKEAIHEEWDVDFEEEDDDVEQHLAFRHNGICFEMHFCLLRMSSKKSQRYLNRLIDASQTGSASMMGEEIPTLEPTVNLLYTFLHLYHHFIELGCGLRQFCDMAVMCAKLPIDSVALEKHLRELGFIRAFRAIEYILANRLGTPADRIPIAIRKEDAKYEEKILNIVFKRGNFGFYGRKTKVRSGLFYYIESLGIKLSHYALFYQLSPKEIRSSLARDIPRKIYSAFKRERSN